MKITVALWKEHHLAALEDAVLNHIWQEKSERCYYKLNSSGKTIEPVFPAGQTYPQELLRKTWGSGGFQVLAVCILKCWNLFIEALRLAQYLVLATLVLYH